jgi:hypothetical protein
MSPCLGAPRNLYLQKDVAGIQKTSIVCNNNHKNIQKNIWFALNIYVNAVRTRLIVPSACALFTSVYVSRIGIIPILRPCGDRVLRCHSHQILMVASPNRKQ